jgi:hypothetical protein
VVIEELHRRAHTAVPARAIAAPLLVAVAGARAWSMAARRGDDVAGFVVLGVAVLTCIVVVPVALVLRSRDWLAVGRRPTGMLRLAWFGSRGLVLILGVVLAIVGPGAWVALCLTSPRSFPMWAAMVLGFGVLAVQSALLGTHLIDVAVRLNARHSWMRYMR